MLVRLSQRRCSLRAKQRFSTCVSPSYGDHSWGTYLAPTATPKPTTAPHAFDCLSRRWRTSLSKKLEEGNLTHWQNQVPASTTYPTPRCARYLGLHTSTTHTYPLNHHQMDPPTVMSDSLLGLDCGMLLQCAKLYTYWYNKNETKHCCAANPRTDSPMITCGTRCRKCLCPALKPEGIVHLLLQWNAPFTSWHRNWRSLMCFC